jgi:hypothetical protein
VSPGIRRDSRRRRHQGRSRTADASRRFVPGTVAGQGARSRASRSRLRKLRSESFGAELASFLGERADHLVSEAEATLRQARLEHYEKDGLAAMRRRLTALLDVTLKCLSRGEADPIITHTTRIARERFSAGYDLLEVQTSINILEEVLWRRILSSISPEELVHALGLVSGLLSLGKDALARTYVALALAQSRASGGPEDDSGPSSP